MTVYCITTGCRWSARLWVWLCGNITHSGCVLSSERAFFFFFFFCESLLSTFGLCMCQGDVCKRAYLCE